MTISARNYAAQAERSLRGGSEIEAHVAEIISLAQHFAIPDGGVLFDQSLRGIAGTPLRLPFDCITVEYAFHRQKRLIVAIEAGADIVMYAAVDDGGGWRLIGAQGGWARADVTTWIDPHPELANGRVYLGMTVRRLRGMEDESGYMSEEAPSLLELLEALNCKNVATEPIQKIDAAKAARRAKDGKLPLYETHRLVINTTAAETARQWAGGTHAPPRQHVRRGHIRRLPSGNYWVNSCVVGSWQRGVIEKNYAVTT